VHRVLRSVFIIAVVTACSGGGTEPAVNSNTGGTGGTGGTPTQTSSVNVDDNQFTPGSVQVAVGATVTWTWVGSNRHDVTFPSGPSSITQTTGTFSRQFPTAGTFTYSCTQHIGMNGTVVVK